MSCKYNGKSTIVNNVSYDKFIRKQSNAYIFYIHVWTDGRNLFLTQTFMIQNRTWARDLWQCLDNDNCWTTKSSILPVRELITQYWPNVLFLLEIILKVWTLKRLFGVHCYSFSNGRIIKFLLHIAGAKVLLARVSCIRLLIPFEMSMNEVLSEAQWKITHLTETFVVNCVYLVVRGILPVYNNK